MALLKSKQVTNKLPVMTGDRASETIVVFGDYTLTGSEATSDVVEMVPLPAGYVPVDVIVDTEDLGTTVTANVGLLSGDFDATGSRTCGATIMSAKALGTAGIYRADVQGFAWTAPASNTRGIGFALSSVSTPTAGAKVRMTLMARPAIEGV